jgi:hypothetical protein
VIGFHFVDGLARNSPISVKLFIISHVDSVTEESSGIQPPGDFLVTNDKDAAYINKKNLHGQSY